MKDILCFFAGSLRCIDEERAKVLGLKPGQKLCSNCWSVADQIDEDIELNTTIDSEACQPANIIREDMNAIASTLGCSPIRYGKPKNKIYYIKRKVKQMKVVTQEKLCNLMDVPPDIDYETDVDNCDKCKDFDKLVDLLVEKCKVSSRKEKIKMLTLVPDSWNKKKIQETFGVTRYVVDCARSLKKEKGILSEPERKLGHPISNDTKEMVQKFYELDEYSRVCPGKKDYVSVIINKEKIHKQKRLLLVNLNELYSAFKERNSIKIGFSKFCELRPKWCVAVGPKGTHSVCVCQYHQNAKLLLAALPFNIYYRDLLSKVVCDLQNRDCMLHACEKCPGKEALQEYIKNQLDTLEIDHDDTIKYKQWVHIDRTTLTTLESTIKDLLDNICESFNNLTQHHFIAKSQSEALKIFKEIINCTVAIILLDFAENYGFIVQDAVQGHHWDNSQATVHPFVMYLKDSPNSDLKCVNMCVISDHLKHDTVAVHAFITEILTAVKKNYPDLKKIIYFSDGASSQYKNFKNLANLSSHYEDHNLSAEWHYFATSHGNSPCDGIGGTVKRLVARASLQNPINNQILTPRDMYNWLKDNVDGIEFFFITQDQVKENSVKYKLSERYEACKTIAGIRSHHSFIPSIGNKLEMRRVSLDKIYTIVTLGRDIEEQLTVKWEDFQPGKYLECLYDANWYVGNIKDCSDEHSDVLVSFMKKSEHNVLSWPIGSRKDECWVPVQHIICIISAPIAQGHRARSFIIRHDDLNKIHALLPKMLQH